MSDEVPTVRVEQTIACHTDAARLWPLITDSERLNRAIGLEKLELEPYNGDSGARYLVTGAVSRRGDRLRVSAGLTDADGHQLWNESYEVDFDPESVFELQDQIAQQIAGVSYPQLLQGEFNRVAKREIESLDAWGHAMNAVEIVNGVNVDRLDEGLLHAERALELDPDLPVAYWARAEIKVYQLVELGLLRAERLLLPLGVFLVPQALQHLQLTRLLGVVRAHGLEPLLGLLALLVEPPLVATHAALQRARELPDGVSARGLLGALGERLGRRSELLVERVDVGHRRGQLLARGALHLGAQPQQGSQTETEASHTGPIGHGMGRSLGGFPFSPPATVA